MAGSSPIPNQVQIRDRDIPHPDPDTRAFVAHAIQLAREGGNIIARARLDTIQYKIRLSLDRLADFNDLQGWQRSILKVYRTFCIWSDNKIWNALYPQTLPEYRWNITGNIIITGTLIKIILLAKKLVLSKDFMSLLGSVEKFSIQGQILFLISFTYVWMKVANSAGNLIHHLDY